MKIETSQVGEVTVISVREKELSRVNSARLRETVGAHLRPRAKIALGLEQVCSIDGLGCGAILSLQRETRALGGEVKVFSLQQPVRSLFQKISAHKQVSTYNAREEVLRSFGLQS